MQNAEMIKVSVVMPIYNAYKYIRPALESVMEQTLRDIEIICVDDGSTDRTLDILKEYQSRDSRIRIVTENNAGPAAARNKGLARVRGEYVIFLDADDFFNPELLEKLYDLAVRDRLDIAICRYDIYNSRKATFEPNIKSEHGNIFEPGKVVSKSEYPDEILQCTTGYVWNKMYRTAFLNEQNLAFNPDLRVFEDTFFVVTSLSVADRIGKIENCLVHHRVYFAQSRNRLFRKYYACVPYIHLKIKNFLMSRGMYIPLSQSYLNLSASRCYKIYNLLWRDAEDEFWNMLHDGYAEKLGWDKAEPDDFESEDVRDFVANVLIYTHKQYKKRESLGLKVRISSVKRSIKALNARKRFKEFFSKLFGKNKEN